MVTVDSFHQARNYYQGRTKPVRLIVFHDMETDEALTDAEAVGNYFAGPSAPKASAHVGVDADSTVGYVRTGDTAFGAAGANADGFHIEQSGRARQSRAEWLDERSRVTIHRAAVAGFEASQELSIPLVQLTVGQVADGTTRGLTDHATVSAAFPKVSTGHTDPGPEYPWDVLLADMEALASPLPPTSEDDMKLTIVKDKDGQVWTFNRGPGNDCIASYGGHVWSLGGQFASDLEAEPHDGGIIIAGVGLDKVKPFAQIIYPGNVLDPAGHDKPDTGWFPLG